MKNTAREGAAEPVEEEKGRFPQAKNLGNRLLRLVLGRRLRSGESSQQQVTALEGIPILGLDALGSSSYGPEAALTILIPLGAGGLIYAREVMGVILLVLAVLYFSYRQTIAEYPGGGGAYIVAKENLGKGLSLIAASSLLLDYTLNVAVGISAGVGALESAFPPLQKHTLPACLAILGLVTIINLRGVKDSGIVWMLPTYAFVVSLLGVIATGILKSAWAAGHPVPVAPPPALPRTLEPISAWLLIRAFASGCTAMTGVEAVSNGVPIFAEPQARNARRTLALICLILGSMLAGIAFLVGEYQVGAMDQSRPGYQSIIAQLASAIVGRGTVFYVLIGSLLAVLTLSANTSFADFPRLCRFLAEDSFLPSTFANRGRRLVYTQGICILALLSALLLFIFNGVTDRLIPLFAVGAFGAFTLSQAGMVNHWRRRGKAWLSPSLFLNAMGALTTAIALGVIIVAKFLEGAWVSLIIVVLMVLTLARIRWHYAQIRREIRPPSELHAWNWKPIKVVIPIEGWNRLTDQALRFASRISEDICAVHVTREESDKELLETWRTRVEAPARAAGLPEPRLEVLHSPYRVLYRPLLDYIKAKQEENPGGIIAVVIPELVEPRWWEYFLHNHVAKSLKTLLLANGGDRLVIINTPWHLRRKA
jgi:amino acid transporter